MSQLFHQIIAIGTEKIVTVERIGGRVVFAVGDDKQGYILIGGDHAVHPEKGKRYIMRFTSGGPKGGYWRIVADAPLLPIALAAPPVPACDKRRYPTKKDATTAINCRTTGHQRHRPRFLRAYPCPLCKGWHLTHEEEYD